MLGRKCMQPRPGPTEHGQRMEFAVLMRRALLLDLEVSHQGNILKLGAVCGEVSLARPRGHSLASALDQLGKLGANATLVLGHNLVRFDLPILGQAAPRHPLLKLPVIDTLVLSPICFPENPYHRLVKDYKLVSESVNDPVADARLAGVLLQDEIASLQG